MPTFRTWCPDFGDTEVDAVSVEAFAHADAAEKAAETLHSSTGGFAAVTIVSVEADPIFYAHAIEEPRDADL